MSKINQEILEQHGSDTIPPLWLGDSIPDQETGSRAGDVKIFFGNVTVQKNSQG